MAISSGTATIRAVVSHPVQQGRFPGVVMVPDRMGLTASIKKQAAQLARHDYVVLAVDPYRGKQPQSAAEADHWQRELPKERILGDVKAVLDYLGERGDVLTTQQGEAVLGTIGFGVGAPSALEAALRDRRVRGVICCYSPLSFDAKSLTSLNGSVLVILAGQDKSVTPQSLKPFGAAMNAAHKTIEGHAYRVYGSCGHGFLDPDEWSNYGEPLLKDVVDAWKLIAAYLDHQLR